MKLRGGLGTKLLQGSVVKSEVICIGMALDILSDSGRNGTDIGSSGISGENSNRRGYSISGGDSGVDGMGDVVNDISSDGSAIGNDGDKIDTFGCDISSENDDDVCCDVGCSSGGGGDGIGITKRCGYVHHHNLSVIFHHLQVAARKVQNSLHFPLAMPTFSVSSDADAFSGRSVFFSSF